MKVGKGNRVLGPLKRDPHVEVSAYRDNQFKVIFDFTELFQKPFSSKNFLGVGSVKNSQFGRMSFS